METSPDYIEVITGYSAGAMAFNLTLFQMLVEKGLIDPTEFRRRVSGMLEFSENTPPSTVDMQAKKYIELILGAAKND